MHVRSTLRATVGCISVPTTTPQNQNCGLDAVAANSISLPEFKLVLGNGLGWKEVFRRQPVFLGNVFRFSLMDVSMAVVCVYKI